MSCQRKIETTVPSCLKGTSIKTTEVCPSSSKSVCGTVCPESPREVVVTKSTSPCLGTVRTEQIQSRCREPCGTAVVVEEVPVKHVEVVSRCHSPCGETIITSTPAVKLQSPSYSICEQPLQTVIRSSPYQSVYRTPCQSQRYIPVCSRPYVETYAPVHVACECGRTVLVPQTSCLRPEPCERVRLVQPCAEPVVEVRTLSPSCGCHTGLH